MSTARTQAGGGSTCIPTWFWGRIPATTRVAGGCLALQAGQHAGVGGSREPDLTAEPANLASIRILEKLGFTADGQLQRAGTTMTLYRLPLKPYTSLRDPALERQVSPGETPDSPWRG